MGKSTGYSYSRDGWCRRHTCSEKNETGKVAAAGMHIVVDKVETNLAADSGKPHPIQFLVHPTYFDQSPHPLHMVGKLLICSKLIAARQLNKMIDNLFMHMKV